MQLERTLSRHGRHGRALLAGLTLAAAGFTAGCASTEEANPVVEQAQAHFQQAQATARIDEFASRSMQQAERNLNQARSLADAGGDPEAIQHYAFLADRYVDIAEARLGRGLTQEEIKDADKTRDAMMLAAQKRESTRHEAQAAAAQARAQEAETKLASTREELEQTRQAADKLAQQVDDLKVKEDQRGTVFTLSDVVFDLNSADLNQGGERSVGRIADTLKQYPKGKIVIQGYTDSTGSDAYNDDLSKRRAQSVKQIFVDRGVPENRLQVEGYGEQYPVATNDTPQGRQLNRRVEIVVAPENASTQPQATPES